MSNADIKKGDSVVWCGKAVSCVGRPLIWPGEVRKVVSIDVNGQVWLEGPGGKGLFGACELSNLKKVINHALNQVTEVPESILQTLTQDAQR